MRYTRRIGGSPYQKFGFGFASTSTSIPIGLLGFLVPMRATPTVTYSGSIACVTTGSALGVTNIVFDQGDANGVSVVATVASGASGFYVVQANADATANITLTAEL